MTVNVGGLALLVLCCLVLGGFIPFMFQPVLGWRGAIRYAGWGSVVVLLVAIGLTR